MRALVCTVVLLGGSLALAQNYSGPKKIGYAGCATDASGPPYSGPQGVTVRLFDQASGSSPLESFDFSNTALGSLSFTNGCFSVELDVGSPSSESLSFDQMDKPLFLEITIGGTVTYGRVPLISSPTRRGPARCTGTTCATDRTWSTRSAQAPASPCPTAAWATPSSR